MVACWDDINHDECSPDLRFCGGRPFELTNEEILAFMELSEIGYRHISVLLSNFVNEEDDL